MGWKWNLQSNDLMQIVFCLGTETAKALYAKVVIRKPASTESWYLWKTPDPTEAFRMSPHKLIPAMADCCMILRKLNCPCHWGDGAELQKPVLCSLWREFYLDRCSWAWIIYLSTQLVNRRCWVRLITQPGKSAIEGVFVKKKKKKKK